MAMKKYFLVMRILEINKALSSPEIKFERSIEPPYHIIPVFENKEDAEAWLDGDTVTQIIEVQSVASDDSDGH